MKTMLESAEPLSKVLWRAETEGKDFSTPERRAGLERSLAEIVQAIGDSKIADYYRRDFDQLVFDNFKRRQPQAQQRAPFRPGKPGPRRPGRAFALPRPPMEGVSSLLKASALGRSGKAGARHVKEMELARLLLKDPEIAERQGEALAALPFSDRSLDTLRHELLNLAASGFRLEIQALENHLVHRGMADLVARLSAGRGGSGDLGDVPSGDEDAEAQFLRAASELREMAEIGPERQRAAERYRAEGTPESWGRVQPAQGPFRRLSRKSLFDTHRVGIVACRERARASRNDTW